LVLYYLFLKGTLTGVSPASNAHPATSPPGYNYVSATKSPMGTPTWPSGGSATVPTRDQVTFPTRAPVSVPTTLTVKASAGATTTPVKASAVAMTNFLAKNYGVNFPNDPTAPSNAAIEWLSNEALKMNTTFVMFNDRLLQRFALVTLDKTFNPPAALAENANRTSFAEQLVAECEWEGVECNNSSIVTGLTWGNKELLGSIPAEIGLLRNLSYLDFSQNQLEGELPTNLYQLTQLQKIYFYQNKFSGTLSEAIGDLADLTHLHLSQNQFSGSIPLSMRSPSGSIRNYRE